MTLKKICAEHEIAVKPRVETLRSAEWRLNKLRVGEKNMTPTELRKAADYLESRGFDGGIVNAVRFDAELAERDAHETSRTRRMLERMNVPITVNAGQLAQALHWISETAWQVDEPVPNGALELMKTIANVHAELLEGVA